MWTPILMLVMNELCLILINLYFVVMFIFLSSSPSLYWKHYHHLPILALKKVTGSISLVSVSASHKRPAVHCKFWNPLHILTSKMFLPILQVFLECV